MAESLSDLLLRNFRPQPMVVLPEHHPLSSSTPAVDVHNHLGRWHDGDWRVTDIPALIEVMDSCNVQTIVNLDGCWGDELELNLDRYDRAHPGRFVTFCRLDWADCRNEGWPERFAESIRDSVRRGAKGVKLWKDIGLRVRDENDEIVFLDDVRLEPMWRAIAETGIPVLVHTADPAAFFEPLDESNERVEELIRHPDWHFYGEGFPPLARLLDALESVVAGHPDIVFIGAHVGCYAENLDWVDRMLGEHPNFNVDIAARIAELGRQPRRTRRLIEKYATRVLLGSDVSPPTAEAYATYFRFLQTDDEYFPYSHENPPGTGRWQISALDLGPDQLGAVEGGNARALIPGL
jgi:predicted TIM-barrel fold metal-dependent hydrolase